MSVSLQVFYKDNKREWLHEPFAGQATVDNRWVPLARKLDLPLLQLLGILSLKERKHVEELIDELKVVEQYVRQPGQEAEYMLECIGRIAPILEQAIAEWDQVEDVSL